MIHLILVVSVVVVIYVAVVLKSMHRPCPRCRPGKPRPRGVCRKCRGTRQVKRFGATAIHRFYWSVVGAASRERRKADAEKALEKAGYPK